jgi:hypothetical protein
MSVVDPEDLESALLQTQAELASVKRTLGTLIAWIAQSAGSPLSVADAERLLKMLPPEK